MVREKTLGTGHCADISFRAGVVDVPPQFTWLLNCARLPNLSVKTFFQPKPEGDGRPVILRSNDKSIGSLVLFSSSAVIHIHFKDWRKQFDENPLLFGSEFCDIGMAYRKKMKDLKPIIVLWCALGLLVVIVAAVRVIQKARTPPSQVKIIWGTQGTTASNLSSNVVIYTYDANGERIVNTNSSPPRPPSE